MRSHHRRTISCRRSLILLIGGALTLASPLLHAEPTPDTITFSGFVDSTLSRDFNDPPSRYRSYTTQPYYTDELALNLAHLDATLSSERYRGRFAAQYGSSVEGNYAAEPDIAVRYIQEAFAGVRVSDALAIDAGVFLSHLGGESWISRDNFTPSRSLVADYSPYYEAGIRSIYTFSPKLRAELHLTRGWQNISAASDPALGTLLTYQVTDATSITHNLFLGNQHGTRIFNDFVIRHSLSSKVNVLGCYDLGVQNRQTESTALWNGFSLIAQYKLSDDLSIAGRVERFTDPHQVVAYGPSGQSLTAVGLSMNVDYAITPQLIWRTEYRALHATRDVFPRHDAYSASDTVAMISLLYTVANEHLRI
jgi:hypothetical protein